MRLQEEPPINLEEVYFQQWTAGVKGGGSGIDVYLMIKDKVKEGIELDSIYFKDMATKLEKKSNGRIVYIGRFEKKDNSNQDFILSSDMAEESKNKLPQLKRKPPYEIKENECLVSYIENGKSYYFILRDVKERESLKYPQAKRN